MSMISTKPLAHIFLLVSITHNFTLIILNATSFLLLATNSTKNEKKIICLYAFNICASLKIVFFAIHHLIQIFSILIYLQVLSLPVFQGFWYFQPLYWKMSLNKIVFSNPKKLILSRTNKSKKNPKKSMILKLKCKHRRNSKDKSVFYIDYQRFKINIGSLVQNSINIQSKRAKQNERILNKCPNQRKKQKIIKLGEQIPKLKSVFQSQTYSFVSQNKIPIQKIKITIKRRKDTKKMINAFGSQGMETYLEMKTEIQFLQQMFCDFNWQQTQIKDSERDSPKERWGHRLLKVKSSLLLFGGFGGIPEGQGNYLNDLWKFDLENSTWEPLNTSGDCPQPRSNYTIHFNEVNNQVIVFGGGASNKIRYNTIYILDLQTSIWRKVTPPENSESPWERTYHSSQFLYPYLVLFGGEGVSYIDLNDTWIFDVRIEEWTKLNPQGEVPVKRRFASSALVVSDFYIIGGCNDNYSLIGDMYKLPLKPLIQGKKQDLEWQCVIKNDNMLQRWGHSCDVFNGKIYIFAGRVSSSHDNSDFLQFNPSTGKLEKIQTKGKIPKPRRRHGSSIVGDCLVILGGYNGNYLKDFHYLKLKKEEEPSNVSIKELKNYKQLHKELKKTEEQFSNSESIQISIKGKRTKINTDLKMLTTNPFFKYLFKNNEFSVELPSFCSVQIFRFINIAITKGIFCLSESYDTKFYTQIVQSLSYFCCQEEMKALQKYLIIKLNPQNSLQLLEISVNCDFGQLNHFASIQELKKGNLKVFGQCKTPQKDLIEETPKIINSQTLMKNTHTHQKLAKSLEEAYHKSAFQIQQKLLRSTNVSITKRTKNFFKSLFTHTNSSSKIEQASREQQKKQRCCSWVFVQYVQSLWR